MRIEQIAMGFSSLLLHVYNLILYKVRGTQIQTTTSFRIPSSLLLHARGRKFPTMRQGILQASLRMVKEKQQETNASFLSSC